MSYPRPGEALVVERYSAEHVKAVILHPAAAKSSRSSEGELVDDEASVRRLLGL